MLILAEIQNSEKRKNSIYMKEEKEEKIVTIKCLEKIRDAKINDNVLPNGYENVEIDNYFSSRNSFSNEDGT